MVLMMIILFHVDVGHVNSMGKSTSISYIEYNSIDKCEKNRDFIGNITLNAAKQNAINNKRYKYDSVPNFKIETKCIKSPA